MPSSGEHLGTWRCVMRLLLCHACTALAASYSAKCPTSEARHAAY